MPKTLKDLEHCNGFDEPEVYVYQLRSIASEWVKRWKKELDTTLGVNKAANLFGKITAFCNFFNLEEKDV